MLLPGGTDFEACCYDIVSAYRPRESSVLVWQQQTENTNGTSINNTENWIAWHRASASVLTASSQNIRTQKDDTLNTIIRY